MGRFLLWCSLICFSFTAFSQPTFPINGAHDVRPQQFAFTNATIFVSPGEVIENGTLLVEGEKIVAVGKNLSIPAGYLVRDMNDDFIYPSFVDAFSVYGMPELETVSGSNRGRPVTRSTKRGIGGWNEAIRPENGAQYVFTVNDSQSILLKKNGFGVVQSIVRDGIARGSSAVVSLATGIEENKVMIRPEAGAHYSFSKGTARTNYPGSLMGSIALLRQTYYDAQWYQQQEGIANVSLAEFSRLQKLPQFFEVESMLDIFRAQRIAQEFGAQYIIKTAGDEYKRIDLINKDSTRLIVPLTFPSTYDVEDPMVAREVSYQQLKHWEMAPYNPGILEDAGVSFALTSFGLKSPDDFWKNLRSAIDHGLSKQTALSALTTIPSEYLGVADKVGTLETGKMANFVVCSDSIFKESSVLYENWVQGQQFVVNPKPDVDIRGIYNTEIAGIGQIKLRVHGVPQSLKLTLMDDNVDSDNWTAKIKRNADVLLFTLRSEKENIIRINANPITGERLELKGELVQSDGTVIPWSAVFVEPLPLETAKSTSDNILSETPAVPRPFNAFGRTEIPKAQSYLFKNATVWTNEADGILENTDVLIESGRIKKIGKGLSAKGAIRIDASGKHLTAGIIDEHSHIAATGGINEATQAVTSEVRIGDIINSEDVNIYRQLAGGVTTSHILHGSANPIGGQSQLIKLRWGEGPEGLKFGGNDGFIKFALGENVKQSNWGDNNKTRFPQTRMGVEQVYVDAFTRAKEYKRAHDSEKAAVRRDLELDALVEILDGERFITCHSYVQSEINMLMHVADRMGFKINTFTHILEGYKVANGMAERGIAGSTFADWWAYKMEVAEAIPYNAYIMHEQGVLTGINSDDAEMARRLNQEAAKIMKYGGLSEEQALKLVTLNPAKMLHIDDRVGSIKPGKDADIVIWSDNPLSVYAKAEMTFIDGIKYWDLKEHEMRIKQLSKEKAELIQKSLVSKKHGARTQKKVAKPEVLYHCESLGSEI